VTAFTEAIKRIDTINVTDPRLLVVDGEEQPRALAQGLSASAWVVRLRPDADEPLVLAARAHHLKRWTVPRDSYPDGRAGYLRWRKSLYGVHADELAAIMRECGYDDASVERGRTIVAKRGLGHDPDVQVFEDAVCLAFLATEYDELADRLDDEKMVDVVRKTLKKMSAEAIALAAEVPLSETGQRQLAAALS
jgi:hypothetical protein